MALTVSKPNNIKMFDGNSLAVYIDADSSELSLKDINGNVSQLSSILSLGVRLTTEDNLILITENNISLIAQEDIGGGIGGTNYIYVMADGTDIGNAIELQAAYDLAKTMSPSATNRITIVCGLGYYNFGSTAFVMDTQYIDLVSLDGNRSIVFNSANAAGTISITASDVFVNGVDVGTKAFTIGNNLSLLKVENCKGGDDSFVAIMGNISGTFTDCVGGASSFNVGGGIITGTFINCVGAFLGNITGDLYNCRLLNGDLFTQGVNIALGTKTPNASAILDVASTTKGLLLPRMTTVERNAIATPAAGLLVYNTTTNTNNYYNGNKWTELGLAGTQYVFVAAEGTNGENATELRAAYTTAQGMSPSATNRITIVAAPGNYSVGTDFVMDTQYIDLVSLDGNRSIVFPVGGFFISANDVFVKGVDVGTSQFRVDTSLNLLRVENCKGGNNSFGSGNTIVSGTFTDCVAGNDSFGATASGTFINCTGGQYSFGSGSIAIASGTFTNCVGGFGSFGTFYSFGTQGFSGTATNCVGGDVSFGGGTGGTQSTGVYYNCVGGSNSFSSGGPVGLQGKLFYCRITSGTFGTVSGGGAIYSSVDGNNDIINTGTDVGIGTNSPNASAILDVVSTTKGLLLPRMTTTQKNAIATPAAGLVIYDTTLNKLCVYTTAWETITSV